MFNVGSLALQNEDEGGDDDEARGQHADQAQLVPALLGLDHVLYLRRPKNAHASGQPPGSRACARALWTQVTFKGGAPGD